MFAGVAPISRYDDTARRDDLGTQNDFTDCILIMRLERFGDLESTDRIEVEFGSLARL